MASTLCILLVSLCCISLSLAESHGRPFMSSSNLKSPTTSAERLIRALNLFPKHEVNLHATPDYKFGASGVVEKRFKLPLLSDPGTSVPNLGHHAGYFILPHAKDARMFYFFFESRNNKTDPVVIWLTGGPGCGSEIALFYENGPFHITSDLSLILNDFGWDKVSNIIFVDQPIGTGFSYSSDEADIRHNEEGVSNDLYDFFQGFFEEHPQYAGNDFYITGESYAGHYIPALASRIQQGNKNKEGLHINLKGLAIGNGLTNSGIQYKAYPDYALEMKLIQHSDYDSLQSQVSDCIQATQPCEAGDESACANAYADCNGLFNSILELSGVSNVYDIRKQCTGELCYDFSNVEKFLNEKSVKDALGVGDIEFVSCSNAVHEALTNDRMKNLAVGIPALMEDGIRVLVYAGEYDLICNWLGNSRWVNSMNWSGQKEFAAAPNTTFSVDGVEAGVQKSHGPLTFLKVRDAGHLVPMDQPKASLEMLRRWMQGIPL